VGSRGPVFPLFRWQIANGGRVIFNHEEMVRPNIIKPNALRLIMNVGALARGGETFTLKMKVMRIVEVAEIMIRELAPEYGTNRKKSRFSWSLLGQAKKYERS
jgi:FlaA1/EpsC-like NDP-sugar epimerase